MGLLSYLSHQTGYNLLNPSSARSTPAQRLKSLNLPAGSRASSDPTLNSLQRPAGQRSSQSFHDLGMESPQREALSLDLEEEQKKRKRLLEQQGFGGTMSAAYLSLMGESGNQF